MNTIKPFHAWKEEYMKTDRSKEGYPILRDKYEYYRLYGNYVSKMRKLNEAV